MGKRSGRTGLRPARPHQSEFLEWAAGRDAAGCFMQMRLGKCLCAIRWALAGSPGKLLITAPEAAIPGWERELAAEGEPHLLVEGTREAKMRAAERAGAGQRTFLVPHGALLTRRGRGPMVPSEWARAPWDAVVFDESERIRNPKAKLTRCALAYLSSAPRRLLLSGLPNPEGPEDYVTQMLFLDRELMGARSFWEWRSAHAVPCGFGWSVRGSSLAALRRVVHERCFFKTRTAAGLPDRKVRSTRWVALPGRVAEACRSAREDLEVPGWPPTDNPVVGLGWEQRLAGGRWPDEGLRHDAKMDELAQLVRGELAGQAVVVWARFAAELDAAAGRLAREGVPVRVLDGRDDRLARRAKVAWFQGGRGARALCAQPRVADVGVDLSAAGASVFLSNYFDLAVRAQVEDRVIHLDRREPALIVDVVARGTCDEDVVEALTAKGATAKSFNARLCALARGGRGAKCSN